ncbi:AlpA family phage regulatory protein [Providencia rettgeri]|nr:AlpA family phage regulatory protein [Providencia rettgeri]
MNNTDILQIVSIAEMMAILGYRSRNSIYLLEKHEGFPPRIRIGVRRVGYDLGLVKKWLESRTMK